MLVDVTSREGGRSGILIAEVEQGAPSWYNGLRRGDVILSVNRRAVASVSDLAEILAERPRTLLLNIQRGRRALFVLLQ